MRVLASIVHSSREPLCHAHTRARLGGCRHGVGIRIPQLGLQRTPGTRGRRVAASSAQQKQQVTSKAPEVGIASIRSSNGEGAGLSWSAVLPATRLEDLQLAASQLKQLVQEAFDQRGQFSVSTGWLASQLRSCPVNGLDRGPEGSPSDAALRLQVYGVNELPPPPSVSFWQLVWEALQDRTLVLLMAAGAVSLLLAAWAPDRTASDWIEGAAILASVLIVVGVGSVTNYHKESKFRALNAIKDDIEVRVIRGGSERSCSVKQLLVGDVLVVETGDILPADGILVQGDELKVDESHMTGESDDVTKSVSTGRQLMLSGSKVLQGYGRMLVLAVGLNSQQGVLAALVMGTEAPPAPPAATSTTLAAAAAADTASAATAVAATAAVPSSSTAVPEAAPAASVARPSNAAPPAEPGAALREQTLLTQKLEGLADTIGNVGVAAAGLVFGVNCLGYTWRLLVDGEVHHMVDVLQVYLAHFITSITILVVAVPEGLPLAVTLALAFSVQRMLKDNNLVRHLDACETMASATTICTDKTGTLTANDMSVVRLWAGGHMYTMRRSSKGSPSTEPFLSETDAETTGAAPQQQPRAEKLQPRRVSPDVPVISGISLSLDGGEDWGGSDDEWQAWSNAGQPAPPGANGSSSSNGNSSSINGTSSTGSTAGLHASSTSSTSSTSSSTWSGTVPAADSAAQAGPRGCDAAGSAAGELAARTRRLLLQSVFLNCTAALCVNAGTGALEKIGNRTECALLEWAMRMDPTQDACARAWQDEVVTLQTFPFSSERKRMSALVVLPDSWRALKKRAQVPTRLLTKGAAEIVLDRCTHYLDDSGATQPLSHTYKQQLLEQFNQQGLRVLALAYRDMLLPSHVLAPAILSKGDGPPKPQPAPGLQLPADTLEGQLVLVGLLGLQDPLREDVKDAIQQCTRAGIKVRMLTGDNARTAAHIARDCRILPPATDIDPLLHTSQAVFQQLKDLLGSTSTSSSASSSSSSSAASTSMDAAGVSVESASSAQALERSSSLQQSRGSQELRSSDCDYDLPTFPSTATGAASRGSGGSSSRRGANGSGSPVAPSSQAGSLGTLRGAQKPAYSSMDEVSDSELYLGPTTAKRSIDEYPPWCSYLPTTSTASTAASITSTPSSASAGNAQQQGQQQQQQKGSRALIELAPPQQDPTAPTATPAAAQLPAASQAALPESAISGLAPTAPGQVAQQQPLSQQQSPTTQLRLQQQQQQPQAAEEVQSGTSKGSEDPLQSTQPVIPAQAQAVAGVAGGQGSSAAPAAQGSAAQPPASGTTTHGSTSVSNSTAAPPRGLEAPETGLQRNQPEAAALAQGQEVLGQLLGGSGASLVLEGPQFRQLVQHADGSPNLLALRLIWPSLAVIARCSPTDKHVLVTGLKKIRAQDEAAPAARPGSPPRLREVIAMTGDGTNDAPALSAADVGFAMNSGTSIAKDAADILLLDNSFSSIVSAVKWGRNVYASVTKFLQFQLTANVVAVVTAGAGALALAHSPLSAVQMLWVNLMMDSLASLALATEAPSDELLDLPPVRTEEALVTPLVTKHILGQAAYQLSVLAALVLWGQELFHCDAATKDTLVFNTFVCMQLFNQLNCRKVRDEPDVLAGLAASPLFYAIVGGEVACQVLIVQRGGAAFSTVPLSEAQWAACVGLGAVTLLVRRFLLGVQMPPSLVGPDSLLRKLLQPSQ